ncbi:hypothetical protein [Streptomyces sp. NPDC002889]|uniref:hypothetical protein n=1 Tax=Streptomyces sp. NPDC002889 TaxID=3364669 RepID=UPI0036831E06
MRKKIAVGAAVGAVSAMLVTAPSAQAEGRGDIRVTKAVVNNGGNVIVGVKDVKTFPIAITIKDNSGVKGVSCVSAFNRNNGHGPVDHIGTSCKKISATTSVCTATMEINPAWIDDYGSGNDGWDANSVAGDWTVNATVQANDGDYWISDSIAAFRVKRAAVLTTNASPEPVAKSSKLTVTGRLTRANWTDLKYHGYINREVQLQFKQAGATSYRTVKSATTNSTGNLRTTVTATSAGSWRWYFPGTATTMRVISAGDAVALK